MSKETLEWLNSNVLVGFTDQRGNAWHYRAGADNHYPGAIPVDDVLSRLFHWHAVEAPLYIMAPSGMVELPNRKAIVRSDSYDELGIFKAGYQPHQYDEWLLQQVANLIDDDLGIGSAGLLKGGAQAWVQVEVPETITTPEGVQFRPNLLACTSFDGSLATTYKRTNTIVVCDNTRDGALGEQGQQFKARHSKYSGFKLQDAREALAIVHTMADDFADEIASLTQWKVSDNEWLAFLEEHSPVNDPELDKRTVTKNEKVREQLNTLYRHDERAAQWTGTALGVLQSVNTYQHHYVTRRSTNGHGIVRAERNMEDVLTGKMAQSDNKALALLEKVTA